MPHEGDERLWRGSKDSDGPTEDRWLGQRAPSPGVSRTWK